MSKKRTRKTYQQGVKGVRVRVPGGGGLIFKRESSGTFLVKGQVRPDHLARPAVQELIREVSAAIDRANTSDDIGVAAAKFRRQFPFAITSVSPAENEAVAEGVMTPNKFDPPKIPEFLLTAVATTRAAEATIGDLNERFADECQKLGRDRAVWLYWARTLRSLWPLLWRAMGKAVKWGAVIAVLRRLF